MLTGGLVQTLLQRCSGHLHQQQQLACLHVHIGAGPLWSCVQGVQVLCSAVMTLV
jgi:hypothetical protein